MNEGPAETWNAVVSHINASATALGLLIGLLRVKGHITEDEIDQLFELTDSMLPEETGTDGANLLNTVRIAASAVVIEPD